MRKSLSAITVFHFLVIWSKYNKMRIRNGKRNYNIVYFWPILINTWVIGLIQQIKRIWKRWGYLDLELKINDLNLLWNQCSHILGKCQFYLLSLFTSGVAPSKCKWNCSFVLRLSLLHSAQGWATWHWCKCIGIHYKLSLLFIRKIMDKTFNNILKLRYI